MDRGRAPNGIGHLMILSAEDKWTFEIPHKISYPYIERYDSYTKLKF